MVSRTHWFVYKNKASQLFTNLLADIRSSVVDHMFHVRLISDSDLRKIRPGLQSDTDAQQALQGNPEEREAQKEEAETALGQDQRFTKEGHMHILITNDDGVDAPGFTGSCPSDPRSRR